MRKPLSSKSTTNKWTTISSSSSSSSSASGNSKKVVATSSRIKQQQEEEEEQEQQQPDRQEWMKLSVEKEALVKLGSVVQFSSELWRVRYCGFLKNSHQKQNKMKKETHLGIELLQPRDEPTINVEILKKKLTLKNHHQQQEEKEGVVAMLFNTEDYFSTKQFSVLVPISLVFPSSLSCEEKVEEEKEHEEEEEEEEEEKEREECRKQTFSSASTSASTQTQNFVELPSSSSSLSSSSSSSSLDSKSTAFTSLQTWVDLLEREILKDQMQLDLLLSESSKAPNITTTAITTTTSSATLLEQKEKEKEKRDIEALIVKSGSYKNKKLYDEISIFLDQCKSIESDFLHDCDVAKEEIMKIPHLTLEVVRRLTFDAEAAIIDVEEKVLEGEASVESLRETSMSAVNRLVAACDALVVECNPSTSSLFKLQHQYQESVGEPGFSKMRELECRRDNLQLATSEHHSLLASNRSSSHEKSDSLTSEFALRFFRLKSQLAAEKTKYDKARSREQEAIEAALKSLRVVEECAREREKAAESLTSASQQLTKEKDLFGGDLSSLREAENAFSAEEQGAVQLEELARQNCLVVYRDALTAAQEGDSDIRSFVRASWISLMEHHSEIHGNLLKTAGELIFRHRASLMQQKQQQHQHQHQQNRLENNDQNNSNENMLKLEEAVERVDQAFRATTLPCLKQNLGERFIWNDPKLQLHSLLESKSKTVLAIDDK